ncbi:MAG: radical SAM protein [Planctomycetia bacterium]|jgi:GTP 3',8-cyclase|nr:radical SAM protein [Planctomycetia bacterium]
MITSPSLLLEAIRVRLDTGCHLRCFFCNSWQKKETRLSNETLLSVLDAAKTNGAKHVALSGGEPLISPVLDSSLAAIHAVRLPSHITTSGVGLEKKAAQLATMGVTHIHLSLESLEGKTRYSETGESDIATILAAIAGCKANGLRVELNYLVLRNKNWSKGHMSRLMEFATANSVDITLLDLLYSWNSDLEHFHVPAEEIRDFLATEFGLREQVVIRDGTVQTEFSCDGIRIRLRDFRARPESSLCAQCATDSKHLGLTPPQISTAGTLAFCSHRRIYIGESAQEAAIAYTEVTHRIAQTKTLLWKRN